MASRMSFFFLFAVAVGGVCTRHVDQLQAPQFHCEDELAVVAIRSAQVPFAPSFLQCDLQIASGAHIYDEAR
jgi:hypothetical protein